MLSKSWESIHFDETPISKTVQSPRSGTRPRSAKTGQTTPAEFCSVLPHNSGHTVTIYARLFSYLINKIAPNTLYCSVLVKYEISSSHVFQLPFGRVHVVSGFDSWFVSSWYTYSGVPTHPLVDLPLGKHIPG